MLEHACPDTSAAVLPNADRSPENAAQTSSYIIMLATVLAVELKVL